MRKINAALFITLDGVVEAPGSSDTTLPEHRGWSMPFVNDEVGQVIGAGMATSDAMLLGRRTYQDFAAFWPNVPADDPFGQIMNNQTKYVVSTTLNKAEWKNSHLIKGDVAAELIDELQLMLCPVVLGVGMRLFDDTHFTKSMKVLEAKAFDSGMIYLRLQPDKKA